MKLSSFLTSFKNQKKFPNLLIIQNNNHQLDPYQLAKTYLKSLVCSINLYCDQCNDCIRINNGNYLDLIYFDNNQQNLTKDDVLMIKQRFNLDSYENKKVKLYVVNMIENVNKQALNALLKFIEEPPNNTYALFICSNFHNVLATIRSRSYFFNLKGDDNSCLLDGCAINDEINELVKSLINLNYLNEYKLMIKLKNLKTQEFNLLFDLLIDQVCFSKKPPLIQLKADLKLNMNKANIAYQILEVLKCEQL